MTCILAYNVKRYAPEQDLKVVNCAIMWLCIDAWNDCMYAEDVEQEDGSLLSKAHPDGPVHFAAWLGKNCPHPKKNKVLRIAKRMKPHSVAIPKELVPHRHDLVELVFHDDHIEFRK